MTSRTTTLTKEAGRLERFPEFPPREDMQNTSHLHLRSILTALAIHMGNPETTLVHGEVPVAPTLDPWAHTGYLTLYQFSLLTTQKIAVCTNGKPPQTHRHAGADGSESIVVSVVQMALNLLNGADARTRSPGHQPR